VAAVTEETNPAPGGRPETGSGRMEYLIPVGVLAVWVVLQIWVLPKAGVPT
jgi:hypothetical protein